MKMIASSRLKGAQTRMEKNRPFYDASTKILNVLPAEPGKKNLIIAAAADRGLCGAINSSIAKIARATIAAKEKEPDTSIKVICMGDKSSQLLGRDQAHRISFAFGELSRKPFTFAAASIISERIMKEESFDTISLIFNRFGTAISYSQETRQIPSPALLLEQKGLSDYEFEEDQRAWHVQDLVEFVVASAVYHAYCDGSAAELGARMAAMDSASRNASDMLKSLSVSYNRGRQAAITTELTEIISGAAAIQ